LTSKTAKEFEFGSLHKEFNLFGTRAVAYVRHISTCQHQQTVKEYFL
jgi:hypothetical protein